VGFRVPLIVPDFPDATLVSADYQVSLKRGWFSNFGPFERAFAAGISDKLSIPGVATFSSASAGLMAAILALVGRGDGTKRIVVPAFTFAAAAQCITLTGYIVEFVDVYPDSFGADLSATDMSDTQGAIAAFLLCNPFGVGTDLTDDWELAAARLGVPLIIDSAAGFGSLYCDGTPVGTRGDCEVFSFHATKPLAIGEGGAVVTRDVGLAERLRGISNFGFDDSRETVLPGFNGKLAEFPASIGVRQLERIDQIVERRQTVLGWYRKHLDVDFQTNVERSSLCFLSVVLPVGSDRNGIVTGLADGGIEARVYYSPSLHRHPLFAQPLVRPLPVTDDLDKRIISLPCHGAMTEGDVVAVARVIQPATIGSQRD
jgi:dTDP-4-amino-4,6-dideoxygalactose transaminase